MDEPDPNLWRRFLALPIESRPKTVLSAFVISIVCAVLVSSATVVLRPIQAANRAAEEEARVDALVRGIPGMSDMLSESGGSLSTVVVDLERGRAASDVTPASLLSALAETSNWTSLEPERDLAGIGARPDYAQVFLLRDDDRISLLLLPIAGQGYNGRIEAVLALRGDMNTIAGVTITRHSETPGLGARIEEGAWQASFPGRQIFDGEGAVRFSVARGTASSIHEVDGITGATRTSNAITQIVRFWLGPDGYGPLITAIKREEF